MSRPRREQFILDVRHAARLLQKPNVEADSNFIDTDAIERILQGAALWLTPKVVEHYHPDDFADWQKSQQEQLRVAVEEFRKIASQVSPNAPATLDQFKEGNHCLRKLIAMLGEMILAEWTEAIKTIEGQAEEWSIKAGWRSRRVDKRVSESLLGHYEVPQLLIYAEPNLYVLDPIARFVPGGQGTFDFAIQPSYETTSLYRDDKGTWQVHLDVQNGISQGRRVEWNEEAFHQCIEQLGACV